MKVVDTRHNTVEYSSLGDPALDSIIAEIRELRNLLAEGKAGRSKAEAKAAKDKARNRQNLKSVKRGSGYSAEKSDDVEKKDKEADAPKGRKKATAASLTTPTSFKDVPGDALIHKSSLRKSLPSNEFADPKNHRFPLKRGVPQSRASIAATLGRAQESGKPDILAKAMEAARAAGMKPHTKLARDRECGKGSLARECKPHGPGGPDEWLRRKTTHGGKHDSESRSTGFHGHGKLPKQTPTKTTKGSRSTERAHAQAGGHAGQEREGFMRTLGSHTLKKLGASDKGKSDVNAPLTGQKWRRMQRANKKQQVKS